MIEFEEGAVEVGVTIVAKGLKISPSLVQEGMSEGTITTLCEQGVGDDEGRYRLTFFSGNRRFRLIVDQTGDVIQSSAVDFGERGLPASARKPGA